MSLALSKVPEEIRLELRRRMPSAAPYTFTHADLTNVDIILDNGNLAGQEDKEWKDLLRMHLQDHTETRSFWLDFYALRKYPNLDERGLSFLNSSGSSMSK
ncbi:PKc-like superfamily domain-containing protein [Histoplasma capsulatum]|uniref:PKc-like superfamily domain-containing protein n=1 Tax=Ajellomyces capsulatus TaxID=5037 RepID=A0A8A1LY31_AJECA|nr:PKc-like superfamily domain-containing protein [Histoplasma capsulatum]